MAKEVTSAELGEIIGISARRVNQIADDGVIFKREDSGNFNVKLCVENFFRNKFEKKGNKAKLGDEKALHEKVKREKTELIVERMKGNLLETDLVEYMLCNMAAVFRVRMLSIPGTMAARIAGEEDVQKIKQALDNEIRAALEEISRTDPRKLMEGGEDESE